MEPSTLKTAEGIIQELDKPRICDRCLKQFRFTDNVTLPCRYHPGTTYDVRGPVISLLGEREAYSCCAGLAMDSEGRSVAACKGCTPCAHVVSIAHDPHTVLTVIHVDDMPRPPLETSSRKYLQNGCESIDGGVTIRASEPAEINTAIADLVVPLANTESGGWAGYAPPASGAGFAFGSAAGVGARPAAAAAAYRQDRQWLMHVGCAATPLPEIVDANCRFAGHSLYRGSIDRFCTFLLMNGSSSLVEKLRAESVSNTIQ
jgi:hypothetical protein